MKPHPRIVSAFQHELTDWRLWTGRLAVLAFAAAAGLTIVAFTWLSERALEAFFHLEGKAWWAPLLWTPLVTGAIVWLTRRFVPGAAGSGIPQVMAVLSSEAAMAQRSLFVSLKLSISKILLTAAGLLGGLSLGREGPSVQIAAGIMRHAHRWLPDRTSITEHGLLMAGGAAGIAAAFNTPLGGVMFAIEELTRKPEQRSNTLLLGAIVLSGLIAVSVYGNNTYFGVIHVENLSFAMALPALVVALASGVAGGLFARLMISSLGGASSDWFSRTRARFPIRFAMACGLVVAILGIMSGGTAYGSGYAHTKTMLAGGEEVSHLSVLLRFVSTWVTAWSGVPGGLFAPALAIGAELGNSVSALMAYPNAPTIIALGMAGFLAAVTQAPLTAFIIVMEMVDGHALVLSLMACTLVSSGISRLISAPLYATLAEIQLTRVR
ncbi:MAG: chloride channel protein [Thauera sp.]|nr:chloride channel protein [Thauera sp.]